MGWTWEQWRWLGRIHGGVDVSEGTKVSLSTIQASHLLIRYLLFDRSDIKTESLPRSCWPTDDSVCGIFRLIHATEKDSIQQPWLTHSHGEDAEHGSTKENTARQCQWGCAVLQLQQFGKRSRQMRLARILVLPLFRYFPKRISATANSSNASLKLISSKTVGLGVYVKRLPSQCCHPCGLFWLWLKLKIVGIMINIRHQRKLATHYISVNRICQGGKPWSSNGVRLYVGLMGWIIMKSGEENPSSLAKLVSRTSGKRGRTYSQAKYSLRLPSIQNCRLLWLFSRLSLACAWCQDTETEPDSLF